MLSNATQSMKFLSFPLSCTIQLYCRQSTVSGSVTLLIKIDVACFAFGPKHAPSALDEYEVCFGQPILSALLQK